jgi:colanic acid/amylovoran biosynthesis glycosyltransferase
MASERTLALVWPVQGHEFSDGGWLLPSKFVDGVREYVKLWRGEVRVFLPRSRQTGTELDYRMWSLEELPCPFSSISIRKGRFVLPLDPASTTVLLLPHPDLLEVARSCLRERVPLVLVTELSLRTQLQILRATRRWSPGRLRSELWHLLERRRWRPVIRECEGLQCNGLPTYIQNRSLNRKPLLFFDGRTTLAECADTGMVEARFAKARQRGAPRLVFSGRLIAIKGVDDLAEISASLVGLGQDFELWIAGEGDRRRELEERFRARGLSASVRFLGVLDFHSQLMRMLREQADIFICPHPQGDPSCTYLETMAAGVPIVGYGNEALEGLVQLAGSGVTVPIHDAAALADAVKVLWEDPTRLRDMSLRAIEFARVHSFHAEFARRIQHIAECSQYDNRT